MRFRSQFYACILVFFVLLFPLTSVYAQLDTEYWMPPVWLPSDSGPSGFGGQFAPTELVISTAYETAEVTVSLSDGTLVSNGTARRGEPLIVDLSDDTDAPEDVLGMTYEANTAESNKGLRITSDVPVQVVYRNTSSLTQNLSPLKGVRALGTDFWVGSQTRVSDLKYGKDDIHFVSVMATEDNTEVTFVSPDPAGSFAVDGGFVPTVTVTLNKNQTYLVRNSNNDTPTNNTAFDDGRVVIVGDNRTKNLAGTHVTSSKPVAVMGGGQHLLYEGMMGDNADSGIDQIVPITSGIYDMIGTQYVLVRGGTQLEQTDDGSGGIVNDPDDSTDYAIIIATEDGTTVRVDGVDQSVTLNTGDIYEFILAGGREALGTPFYVETSKTAYLYHVSGLQLHELGMSVVPTIDCAGSQYIAFNRFNNANATIDYDNTVNIIAPTSAFGSMVINGQEYATYLNDPVADRRFNGLRDVAPGPDGESWSTATFNYPPDDSSTLEITADDFFHVGVVVGGTEGGTYGYLSNFARNVDVLDPDLLPLRVPTPIYTVGTVAQGDSISECLQLRSCGTEHQIDSIRLSDNTGRAYPQADIGQPEDTCLWYVAKPDYVGNDTIRVYVSNDLGLPGEIQLVFRVVARPEAVADTFAVAPNDVVSGNVLDNDLNIEAGEEAELSTDVSQGSVTLNPDGTFTYRPAPDFVGTDSLVYQVCDNLDASFCSVATVYFVVSEAGAISAENNTYTLDRNTTYDDDLAANVNDPSGQGVVFTTTPVSGPENGTITLNTDGTFTYTPNENFFGRDSVRYEVCVQNNPTQCVQATAFFLVVIPDDDDIDSDGDSIPDVIEVGDDQLDPDDTDDDGTPDYLDPDSDDDTIPDVVEVLDDPRNPVDTDNDGTPDYLDTNSDDDPLPDIDEAGPDPNNPQDTDGDGLPDYRDPDQAIRVYEGFSPGGTNPTWVIDGIGAFPNNRVEVFNRWGNKVYEIDGYNNTDRVWRGNANVSSFGDNEVPDGTYFYLIDLGQGDKPRTGYVVVNR